MALPKTHPVAPLTRCSVDHYPGPKCREPAKFWLYAPDGEPVPGGCLCDSHATSIHEEYLSKLGEDWPLVPVADGR